MSASWLLTASLPWFWQVYKTASIRIDSVCCGSGSAGSVCARASRIRIRIRQSDFSLLCDFLSLKNNVNIPSKSNKQKTYQKEIIFGWRSDPYQNVTDLQHCVLASSFIYCMCTVPYLWSGVAPRLSCLLTSAPAASSKPTISAWPYTVQIRTGWAIWKYWKCPCKFFSFGSCLVSALSTPNGGEGYNSSTDLNPDIITSIQLQCIQAASPHLADKTTSKPQPKYCVYKFSHQLHNVTIYSMK